MLTILMLILGAGGVVLFMANEMGRNIPAPRISLSENEISLSDASYLRNGWQKEAYPLLRNFIAASSCENKLPYILNADTLAPMIAQFYGTSVINDADTPADGFSIFELSMDDRKRGIFLMTYEQLTHLKPDDFFKPLASAEVQAGIADAGLLQNTMTRADNDTMDPVKVFAFFKRVPEGLKLDWEVFAQSKYRTFLNFVEMPAPGRSAVFRTFIVEDYPDNKHLEAGTRTYRLFDISNRSDSARVNVMVDSKIGRSLSVINWRDTKENKPGTRTVTLELKWSGEPAAPVLEISRFICWEFLGLGGEENPKPASTK